MTDVRNIITNDKVANTRFDGHANNAAVPTATFIRNSPAGAGVQSYVAPEDAVGFYIIASNNCRLTLDGSNPSANQGLFLNSTNARLPLIRIQPGTTVKVYHPASNAVLLQWVGSV